MLSCSERNQLEVCIQNGRPFVALTFISILENNLAMMDISCLHNLLELSVWAQIMTYCQLLRLIFVVPDFQTSGIGTLELSFNATEVFWRTCFWFRYSDAFGYSMLSDIRMLSNIRALADLCFQRVAVSKTEREIFRKTKQKHFEIKHLKYSKLALPAVNAALDKLKHHVGKIN